MLDHSPVQGLGSPAAATCPCAGQKRAGKAQVPRKPAWKSTLWPPLLGNAFLAPATTLLWSPSQGTFSRQGLRAMRTIILLTGLQDIPAALISETTPLSTAPHAVQFPGHRQSGRSRTGPSGGRLRSQTCYSRSSQRAGSAHYAHINKPPLAGGKPHTSSQQQPSLSQL